MQGKEMQGKADAKAEQIELTRYPDSVRCGPAICMHATQVRELIFEPARDSKASHRPDEFRRFWCPPLAAAQRTIVRTGNHRFAEAA